jgi:hypothetical protein
LISCSVTASTVTIGGRPPPPCGEAATARLVSPKTEKRQKETIHALSDNEWLQLSACRWFGAAEVIVVMTLSRDVSEKTGPAHSRTARCCIFFSFAGGLIYGLLDKGFGLRYRSSAYGKTAFFFWPCQNLYI